MTEEIIFSEQNENNEWNETLQDHDLPINNWEEENETN